MDESGVWRSLTHTGSILSCGQSSWATVKTLVSSVCVAALLVSRTYVPHTLVDVCESENITAGLLKYNNSEETVLTIIYSSILRNMFARLV